MELLSKKTRDCAGNAIDSAIGQGALCLVASAQATFTGRPLTGLLMLGLAPYTAVMELGMQWKDAQEGYEQHCRTQAFIQGIHQEAAANARRYIESWQDGKTVQKLEELTANPKYAIWAPSLARIAQQQYISKEYRAVAEKAGKADDNFLTGFVERYVSDLESHILFYQGAGRKKRATGTTTQGLVLNVENDRLVRRQISDNREVSSRHLVLEQFDLCKRYVQEEREYNGLFGRAAQIEDGIHSLFRHRAKQRFTVEEFGQLLEVVTYSIIAHGHERLVVGMDKTGCTLQIAPLDVRAGA